MDLQALHSLLVSETMGEHVAAKPPSDVLQGLMPAEAEAKADEILAAAIDAQKQMAALKSELAPVLKLAKSLGTSRRFQQMVKAADADLVAIGSLLTQLQEVEGHWKTGTQDQLIKVIVGIQPDLEDMLKDAKEKAKNFNQGFSKVRVWDKAPEDKRKKAPYEVKLAADKVAALEKEAGIWDVLKKALVGVRKLSDAGLKWAQALFSTLYESHFESVVRGLHKVRKELEHAVSQAA